MEKFFRSAIRRYYEVELPRNHARRKRWPLLVALHGYEGNKDSMMRVAQHIADGNMVVISLQGPYQFFRRLGRNPKNFRVVFGWGTTYKMEDSIRLHHRDLETIIELAVRKYHADPQRVFLAGFFAGLRPQLPLCIYPPASDSRRRQRVRRCSRRLE